MSHRGLVGTGAISAAALLVACSLAVSTSGLSGGADPSVDDSGGAADAITAVGDGGTADTSVADSAPDAPVDPSLVAAYSFEDPIGSTVHDSSGNGHDGLLQANASFVADGIRGRALAVDTTGFFVAPALAGDLFPKTGTISIWFRFDFAPDSPAGRSVFDDWDNGRAHVFVRRAPGAAAGEFQMALQSMDDAGQYSLAATFQAARNTWTHVVVTWDAAAGIGAFYASGVLVHRGAYEQPFALTNGQHFRFGEGLIGGIDEVRLFSRALPAEEVAKLD